MSKPERQEALDYLRGRYTLGVRGCAAPMHCSVSSHPLTLINTRVVVFIDQLRELLELVLSKWNTLTDDQKAEVAQHIIPEVAEEGGEGIRRGVTCTQ